MPKISVSEKDLSWYYRQRGLGAMTVYIPGVSTFGPEDKPVLCDSSNFVQTFGTAVQGVEDFSYNMAASYIKSGFNVLFHRFVSASAVAAKPADRAGDFDIGDDSNNLTISAKYKGSYANGIVVTLVKGGAGTHYIYVYSKGKSSMLENFVVNFTDPTDPKYVTTIDSSYIDLKVKGTLSDDLVTESSYEFTLKGGLDFAEGTTSDNFKSEIRNAILTSGAFDDLLDPYQFNFDIVESAGWCDFSDLVKSTDLTTHPDWIVGLEKIDQTLFSLVKERKNSILLVVGHTGMTYSAFYTYCGLFNSDYAVGIGPWGYARFVNNGSLALLPGSYPFVVAWANSCASGNPAWMAPAGVKRATLGSFYKDTEYVVGKAVLDAWQNHDYVVPNDYKVIPIMKAKQYGYVVYGNSTLLRNSTQGSTSMLQSLSVRILANMVKNKSFDISLSLQFDQMDNDLYAQFKTLMSDYMDQLRYQGALYDYEIVLDSTSVTRTDLNEKTVPVLIRISPNPAAENFDITLEISQAGVTFSDETDENENA